jgi:DNA polymerase IV (DinB-like DNA polymerase)
MQRIIMLIDMDAFYTSCEEVRNPSLKGKPVVVGADPKEGMGRGVIATCNYEARKYGLHSAMPISIAYRKCPSCIFLPVDMDYYVEVSLRIMKIFKKYADKLEQVSIDEAYLDVSSQKTFEKARELAIKIKKEVEEKEKITCSVGISVNKLVAKMAASKNKPNGLTIVLSSGIQKFLDPLDADELYGVGPKTSERLKLLGIYTIGQLSRTPLSKLTEFFGPSFGTYLHEASRGIDESPVSEEWTAKSTGRQITFEQNTRDKITIYDAMEEIIKDSFLQLKQMGFKSYRTITLKVRYEDFETHTKAFSLKIDAMTAEPAKNVAKTLIRDYLKDERKIRLIGVTLSKLK